MLHEKGVAVTEDSSGISLAVLIRANFRRARGVCYDQKQYLDLAREHSRVGQTLKGFFLYLMGEFILCVYSFT